METKQSTHKYISELLGKETLDTRNRSVSRGSHGSSSVSYQQTGRELMTPDEVRTWTTTLPCCSSGANAR